MSARVKVVYQDATLRQAYARNVHLVAWFDAPSLDQMHAYGRCAKALSERYGGESCLFNVVVTGVPRFSAEVRQAAADYSREGAHTVGTAHVILVGGLLGSSVRAFLSTAMLLGRPPNPTKVFATLDAAGRWMAQNLLERSSERWSAAELTSLCELFLAPEGEVATS
jgi:hypothetical protein